MKRQKIDWYNILGIKRKSVDNDIKDILSLFTTGIQKFEENKDLFDEGIEDIKNYCQELKLR